MDMYLYALKKRQILIFHGKGLSRHYRAKQSWRLLAGRPSL